MATDNIINFPAAAENAAAKETKKVDPEKEKQRTMFLMTIPNPQDYGYSIETVESILQTRFKGLKYYCLSSEYAPSTGTPHYHVFFICNKVRWETVRRRFPHAHLEDEVRGTPKQVRDYISKEAEKLTDDKKDSLDQFIEWGILPDAVSFNKENLLEEAEQLIQDGKTPTEIFELSILFRKYEAIIRKAFYAKRYKETPPKRQVDFIYHIGNSGSGKSHSYVLLSEKYGADEVFISADYTNRGNSLMDGYTAESCVFLDELKPDSLPYGMLLNLTDCYRLQLHCRYANAYALYKEIHVTSIFPPEKLYESMVDSSDKENDPISQLLRRITTVVYHYKDSAGNYCTYEMAGKDYTNYDDLLSKVHSDSDGFISVTDTDVMPFDD